MRIAFSVICFSIAIAVAASAASAHDDVVPYEFGGKIVTGGHDDGADTNTIATRVFGYDFGEEPSDPYFIPDPGFNNGAFAIGIFPNNGLLPAGKTLAFNVVTTLQYWDANGPVAFVPAPAGVSLGLQRGSFTVSISGTGQTGTVPTIGSTGTGRLHVHLGSLLNYTDGIDPELPNAPDGVYMIGLELKLLSSSVENSDTIYFVYNNNVDEGFHDEAMDWVQTNLVPEPSAWILAVTASVAALCFGWRNGRRAAKQ